MFYVVVFLACCLGFDVTASNNAGTPAVLNVQGQPKLESQNSGSQSQLSASALSMLSVAPQAQRADSGDTFHMSNAGSSFTLSAGSNTNPLPVPGAGAQKHSVSMTSADFKTPHARDLDPHHGNANVAEKSLQDSQSRVITQKQTMQQRLSLRAEIAGLQHRINLANARKDNSLVAVLQDQLRMKETQLSEIS